MNKHAVVLAAGKSQLPYILEFKKRGWYVTAIDQDPSAMASTHSDKFIVNSVYERNGLVNILSSINRNNPITAVFSNSSAAPVAKNVAYLNNELKTQGGSFSPYCVEICYDKSIMLNKLRQAKVNVAKEVSLNMLTESTLPIIVKPAHNSLGGKGVNKIETSQELQSFLMQENTEKWVIEQYIEGTEYSVDGLIVGGELEVLGVSKKVTVDIGSAFIPISFSLEISIESEDPERFKAIYQASRNSAKALGIDNSQISLDLKVDSKNTVTIIECGLFWDSKIDRLFEYSGFNPYAYHIDRIYEGKQKTHHGNRKSYSMEFIYSDTNTSFNTEKIRSKFNNDYLEFEKSEGDKVAPPSSVADVLACRFYES